MAAAPLIVGADIPNMAQQNLDVITNRDVIAIDQDRLGVQAFTVSSTGGHWVLQRPLADGDTAVALFNANTSEWPLASAPLDALGLDPHTAYLGKDLWSKETRKVTDPLATAVLAPHETVIMRLSTRAPALSVPQAVTAHATEPTGVAVSYAVSAHDAFDGALAPDCSHPSGSVFPIGPTTVTCTATDAAGRSTTSSFVVQVSPPEHPLEVSGTVPATLSLTLGESASFGAFVPGVARDYTASTTANVISTAGDATLSVSDPGHLSNGAVTLADPLGVTFSKSAWTAPVSNDPVTIMFSQHIGENEPLRTGTYSRTLTFTLSTTSP
jgi:hypothetical protein